MSDFRIDKITNRDGSAGTQIARISTFSATSGMQLPSGPTEYRGGRGRAVRAAGRAAPTNQNTMDYVEIATTGNAVDFGDLSSTSAYGSSLASSTRGVVALNASPAPNAYSTRMDYYTFSSGGGASEFGNLQTAIISSFGNCASNATRGLFQGGRPTPGTYSGNAIEFITIATKGDASNFGDLTRPITSGSGTESPTRGFFAGGYTRPVYNPPFKAIEFTNFSSLGNTVRFGELFTGRYRFAGCSSPTRGIFMGGRTPSNLDVIEYFTMATEGNGQDFGNLPAALGANAAASNQTRGLSMGGGPGSGDVNTISYITISTTGDATDFGDLTEAIQDISGAASDSHGGLG